MRLMHAHIVKADAREEVAHDAGPVRLPHGIVLLQRPASVPRVIFGLKCEVGYRRNRNLRSGSFSKHDFTKWVVLKIKVCDVDSLYVQGYNRLQLSKS